MRGLGAHVPPFRTQNHPVDNTGGCIDEQVRVWAGQTYAPGGRVVHYEIAREIASLWASFGTPLHVFASTGEIRSDLLVEIDAEIRGCRAEWDEPGAVPGATQLRALRAYVGLAGTKGVRDA